MGLQLVVFLLLILASSLHAQVDQNPHGDLGLACSQCHSTESWSRLKSALDFDHGKTRFPLVGRHTQMRCIECHTSLVFSQAGEHCLDCHLDVHRGQFGGGCEQCHTPAGWDETSRMVERHHRTRFPLVGVHASLDCKSCHANGQYAGLSVTCESCHLNEYRSVENPDHVAAGFSRDCAQCHSVTIAAWKEAQFTHTPDFPLTAGHAISSCIRCHEQGYAAISGECYPCHAAEFAATTNPDHEPGNFSHNCSECHTTGGWQPAEFDHDLSTFPLTGAHIAAACTQCHTGGQFSGTTSECIGCHQADYAASQNPDHEAGEYSNQCAECHTTDSWRPASFDHNLSDFALTGAHITANCASCHTGGQFTGTPTDCWSCHQTDYTDSDNPDHEELQLAQSCEECHTTTAWQPAEFDHNLTDYPLTGAHISAECASCHTSGQFSGTPTDCWSCHQADYDEAESPNHAANLMPHGCEQCHTTTAWAPSTFDHTNTTFPLTGAHIVAACAQCHVNGQYTELPSDCYSCHQADYADSDNPDHASGGYSQNCSECHTTAAWHPAQFDHNLSDFPLTGAHVQANCASCHVGGQFTGTATDCWSCHEPDYVDADDPSHTSNQFPHDCQSCHTTTAWEPSSFNHSSTDFPLTGAHVAAQCAQCHLNGDYVNTSTDCWSCHQADYTSSDNPDHEALGCSHTCTECHTTTAWQPAQFDHNLSDFPLTGAHIGVNCAECHTSGQWEGTPTDCWSCHEQQYNETDNPNHAAGNFAHDCAQCHTTAAWQPAEFDHNLSDFPLTGAHVSVSCTECHVGGQFTGTPTDCWSCHNEDYGEADDPNHAQNQFPHECLECHTTVAWTPSSFNHNDTDFPLTGAHVEASCIACHTNGQYTDLATDCWSCHQQDYADSDNPDHESGEYSHTCTECHTTIAWQPAQFDHNLSDFPLTGAHVAVSCTECHTGGQFADTPTDCWSCHQEDFNEADEPDHAANLFPHACAECHTTSGWEPSSFDHANTQFPLTGAHVAANCAECHTNGNYTELPVDCWSCHNEDYNSSDNPSHTELELAHECLECHTTNAWQPAQFDHNLADFPLTGAHVSLACAQCHDNGQYSGTPADCWSCHQTDYQTSENPDHVAGNFPQTCQQCHTTTGWQPAQFDHNLSDFPLTGAHVSVSCTECHVNGQYTGTPTDCWSCHETDYGEANDPNHAANLFPHACLECHTTAGWSPSTFDHATTDFPLTGAHVAANCAQCHTGGQYTDLPTSCWSCHEPDYTSSDNPDHESLQFPQQCEQCHTTTAWQPASFDHNLTDYPLTGAHVNVNCAECHTNGQYPGTPTDCWSCHQEEYQSADEPNHAANQLPHNCESCHATSGWTPSSFNHNNTNFPLTGAHVSANCAQCHVGGQFAGTPTDCWSCHEPDYAASDNPDHEAGGYSQTCTECHTTTAWAPAQFDHNLSDFPLTGAHVNASCTQCHVGGQYTGTSTDCWSCHEPDYVATTNPDHEALQMPQACQQCHTTTAWQPASFDHNLTDFPLTGAHVSASCVACHADGQYANTPSDCWSCHEADYQIAQEPNHVQGQLPHACAQCHSTSAWEPSTFNHNNTGFPLTGAHISAACAECHVNGQFAGTPTDCWTCHLTDYQNSDNPDHEALQMPHACAACHSTVAWQPAAFDHNLTDFPLTGAHINASCTQCHTNGQYEGTPADCWSCHQTDYQQANDPNHVQNMFPHACQECHTTSVWEPSTFNHAATQFPLLGAHQAVSCVSCHTGGNYVNVPTDCWSCHNDDFAATVNPDHEAGNFSHNCATCHTVQAWQPASFDHNLSDFPLTGAHVSVSCVECHANGQYTGTPTDCWSCHQSDYEDVDDPNHVANQFSHTCTQCHNTAAWEPATFDHNLTDFPLTGAHINASCTQCHANGQYDGTPMDCWSCHDADFQSASEPNHVTNQFPHACQECHNTVAWEPSTFNHSSTQFPLTGAHVQVSCTECHTNGNYVDLPVDCWSCHQDDYENVDDPNHVSNQFSHACTECHNTVAWSPATFDHNLTDFPLTGAHISAACAQCHVNGQYGGTSTECWSCHQADFTGSDNPDHEAGNFPHTCAQCHSTTAWQPASFDHNLSSFPLTGAHLAVSCTECHVNGQYTGTPEDCWSCHQPDYMGADDHASNNYPHDCLMCHATNAWEPSSFNHNNTDFPLTGAHISVNCAECHVNGQFSGTPTDCWSCHEQDYNDTDDPNHAAAGFSHNCLQCHTTSDWESGDFNHNNTQFPLTGAHVNLNCASCHGNGQYADLPADCWSCHQGDYQTALDPNHVQGQYPQTCAQCHSTAGWSPATFDHNQSNFPLTGAHVNATCAQCHVNGQYEGTPVDCWSCHQADYGSADDPNHVTNLFPHACQECHSTATWEPSTFNHAQTQFPLTGAHLSASCIECHANGNYSNLATDCWSCHQQDYNGADDHLSNNYPHDCQMCHTTNAWEPSSFNHNNTQFPLTGAHVSVNCAECHVNGQFDGTPTDCWSCHQQDYNDTDDPDHAAAGFSQNCLQCHTTSDWESGDFNHNNTQFPLTGAHISLNCASCHANGQYADLPADCWSCHQDDYQTALDPNHVQGQYPQTCAQCHSTAGWSPASFDHNQSNFPLTGAHINATCAQCHVNGQYDGTPTACWGCHASDFQGANDPDHETLQFPHTCQECHSTNAWEPASFNHNNTDFPLTGAHINASCSECHVNGQYNGTPTDCYFCHQGDYSSATSPNHAAGGFPTDCAMCHSTIMWDDAQFSHPWFPITSGNHQEFRNECNECHVIPNNFTAFSCIDCHEHNQPDTDDDHDEVQGYQYNSQACYSCHPNGDDLARPPMPRGLPQH